MHTNHDKPLWLLNTFLILLRISEFGDINTLGFGDLISGTVADEDGLSSPFDNDLEYP